MAGFANAEYRCALLIGNSNYPEAELSTPATDVKAMAEVLKRRGFRVTVAEDLSGGQMKQTVEEFAATVPVTGTAVVYFAGYALFGEQGENRRDNYFLPIDGNPKSAWEVARAPFGVNSVLEYLSENGGSRTNLVFVDGCYLHSGNEAKARGLKELGSLPAESVVAYAASLGKTVEPGEQAMAAFTSKLVKQLGNRNTSLLDCLQTTAGHYEATLSDGDRLAEPVSKAISPPDKFTTGRKAGDEWVNRHGMVFCWCPDGSFLMGSPRDLKMRYEDEGPVEVKLPVGFWISKYELTRQQSRLLTGRTPYRSRGDHKNQPVNGFDINEFTSKFLQPLNAQERKAGALPGDWEYAMPTEAQWEYAARAGTSTPRYFGEDVSELSLHGNFADRQLFEAPDGYHPYANPNLDDGQAGMARVGLYRPNPWGLHDVYGNVWEWCDEKYQSELPGGADPRVPAEVSERDRAARGGCWLSPAEYCRSAVRHRFTPGNKSIADKIAGYRLVIRRVRR